MKNTLIAVGSVLGFLLFVGWCARGPGQDVLKVSAGRGATSIVITSHEEMPLRDCVLRVLDSSGTTWSVSLQDDLVPSASATIAWDDFRSNGQPMPGHVGRDRSVTITCDVGQGGPRKSAGIGH